MQANMSLSMLWSKAFLTSKMFLWLLFIVNLAGTVYGYMWYWDQLVFTTETEPLWFVIFVPDSPTASLFFTLSLLYLIMDQAQNNPLSKGPSLLRGFVEAFALVTSVKYGIWAVAMIMAGAVQGNSLVWQDWMLTASHLGMAAEALLFARWYKYGILSIGLVGIWTLWNDYMDYSEGIFPGLSKVLLDDLNVISIFTMSLSVVSLSIACLYLVVRLKRN